MTLPLLCLAPAGLLPAAVAAAASFNANIGPGHAFSLAAVAHHSNDGHSTCLTFIV